MSVTFAFDAIADDYRYLPSGYQVAGYDTGGPGYAWTPQMWAAHPGAVHIDQDVEASDFTADILDCENGAVPVGSSLIPHWAGAAQHNFTVAARPGQRRPALYCSASNITANVNALVQGGIRSGVGLWVASWGIGEASAVQQVTDAAGPFPVIGLQFDGGNQIDSDVFSTAWLNDVSGRPQPPDPHWTFGPLVNFELANYGPHSLEVSFSAPQVFTGTPPLPVPGITQYQMIVTEGSAQGPVAPGYPRYLPKSRNPETWEEGGLEPGTAYTVRVRVYDTVHAGLWSVAAFTTPGS
jgi:hypothetical protein